MLYTVVPLERIYSDKSNEPMKESDNMPEYKDISLKYGLVRARRDGEQYVVEHMNSTDMTDYLREEFTPGSTLTDLTNYDV